MRVVGQFGPVVDDFGELRQRAGHVASPSLQCACRYERDALGKATVDRARQPDRLLVVSEGGVRSPIADELSARVRDPGSTGRTRIGEPRRKVGDGLGSDRLAAVAGSERSIDPSKDMGVHVTDGLGAASELLGSRAALVESA
jgi:hypothetical protein